MARVFREPSGRYYAVKSDGTKVELPEGYERNIMLHDTEVSQEQGVSGWERFFLKNFDTKGNAGDVEGARKWLEKRGYETRRLNTSGFNFAVRQRGSNGPWKVLDPDTGIFGKDFLSDMADLTSDAIMALGAVGTGGIGGAALVAGGAELGREIIGEIGGLEENISPLQVGLQAGAAAVAPAVGRGVKAGLRAVAGSRAGKATGNFLTETAAKVAGVKPLQTEAGLMSPGKVLKDFASQAPGKTYMTVKETARKLQGMVNAAWGKPMGERIRLNHMLRQAAAQGEVADLRAAIKPLTMHLTTVGEEVSESVTRRSITEAESTVHRSGRSAVDNLTEREGTFQNLLPNKETGKIAKPRPFHTKVDETVSREGSAEVSSSTTREATSTRTVFKDRAKSTSEKAAYARHREDDLPENAATQIRKIYSTIADAMGVRVDQVDLARVPVNVADKVQAGLRGIIDDFNGYKRMGNLDLARPQLAKALKETAYQMRSAITSKMDPWGGKINISQAGRLVQTDKFSFLYTRLAERTAELHNLAKAIGAREKGPNSWKAAANFIRATVGDATPEALRNFERQFPHYARGMEKAAFEANLAEAVAGRGSRGIPGNFARFSAVGQPIGMGAMGMSLGGFYGGVPGAAVGAASMVGASAAFSPRAMVGATRLAMKGIPSMPKTAAAARLAATAALQQAARSQSGGSKTVASESQPKRKAYFTGG